MKLALINIVKPGRGSGDGITEYTYQLYNALNRMHKIDYVYAIDESKRNNISGLIRANLSMRNKMSTIRCNYDLFHVTNQEAGFASKMLSKKCTAPVVTTIHDISRFVPGLNRGVLQSAYNRMIRAYVKDAVVSSDFLIFDSNQTMNEVRKKFNVGRSGQVVNIGVKDALINKPKVKMPDNKKFNVGYIGSFAYHKNVMLLLEAANIIDNDWYTFSVYGSGVEYERLEAYKKLNKLNSVKLMGFASEDRIVQIYDSFDAFVFPSLYEGFGLPILEAQARGLPVVIYKKGRISEEVKRYCFEAEDAAHMANIIDDLRENGYDGKMRKAAMEYARSFTWQKCAHKTSEIYRKLVG
jgi:glycosyltransferase involved in cell wall biosynthesis